MTNWFTSLSHPPLLELRCDSSVEASVWMEWEGPSDEKWGGAKGCSSGNRDFQEFVGFLELVDVSVRSEVTGAS